MKKVPVINLCMETECKIKHFQSSVTVEQWKLRGFFGLTRLEQPSCSSARHISRRGVCSAGQPPCANPRSGKLSVVKERKTHYTKLLPSRRRSILGSPLSWPWSPSVQAPGSCSLPSPQGRTPYWRHRSPLKFRMGNNYFKTKIFRGFSCTVFEMVLEGCSIPSLTYIVSPILHSSFSFILRQPWLV